MGSVHISEGELAEDVRAALDKVQSGTEVVIERNARAIAIMKPLTERPRLMSEIIADMEAGGACASVDDDFARDVEEGIASRNEPWNPPSLD